MAEVDCACMALWLAPHELHITRRGLDQEVVALRSLLENLPCAVAGPVTVLTAQATPAAWARFWMASTVVRSWAREYIRTPDTKHLAAQLLAAPIGFVQGGGQGELQHSPLAITACGKRFAGPHRQSFSPPHAERGTTVSCANWLADLLPPFG